MSFIWLLFWLSLAPLNSISYSHFSWVYFSSLFLFFALKLSQFNTIINKFSEKCNRNNFKPFESKHIIKCDFFWNVFIILLCLAAFILLRNLSKFNRLYDMWVCGYMAVGLCVRFNWFGQSMLDVSYVNHFDWLVWLINDWHFIVL